MSVSTIKCPNCDGGLIFDPNSQKFICEYCQSSFAKEAVDAMTGESARNIQEGAPAPENAAHTDTDGEEDFSRVVVYSCPSCGAEVATDDTTAATYCYYCHNPVVLTGRLEGAFRPSQFIPFAFDKEQAKQAFLSWVRKKRFVPGNFFSEKQIEMITGVYYPYWLVDADVVGEFRAKGVKIRTWEVGDVRYTETREYAISRNADMTFEDIAQNALNKENSRLANGVLPFDGQGMKAFSPAYLSGFQAEKRNVEQAECEQAVQRQVDDLSRTLIRGTAGEYTAVTGDQLTYHRYDLNWDYTLLPVWILTYKGRDGSLYYYTMNGQTGKSNGKLPVDMKKLSLFYGALFLLGTLLLLLGGYFL